LERWSGYTRPVRAGLRAVAEVVVVEAEDVEACGIRCTNRCQVTIGVGTAGQPIAVCVVIIRTGYFVGPATGIATDIIVTVVDASGAGQWLTVGSIVAIADLSPEHSHWLDTSVSVPVAVVTSCILTTSVVGSRNEVDDSGWYTYTIKPNRRRRISGRNAQQLPNRIGDIAIDVGTQEIQYAVLLNPCIAEAPPPFYLLHLVKRVVNPVALYLVGALGADGKLGGLVRVCGNGQGQSRRDFYRNVRAGSSK